MTLILLILLLLIISALLNTGRNWPRLFLLLAALLVWAFTAFKHFN